MSERIRWRHVDGTVVESFGYVGTVDNDGPVHDPAPRGQAG